VSVLLRFAGVTKVYGRGPGAVRALDRVDLAIDEGELVALMGPSGSGKSTALQIMGCLDVPSTGASFFRGLDTARLDIDALSLLRRDFIGFVFQGFHLLPRTSALENVELPLVYRGLSSSTRRTLAKKALRSVGLTGVEHHLPNELSGGEQQRVAIARALVGAPALVLADEPTGNLDSARAVEIMQILAGLNREQGITVVMVTHEPDMAAWARRIVRFKDGRVIADVGVSQTPSTSSSTPSSTSSSTPSSTAAALSTLPEAR
jgi:putative ABC transport system ATP-binding protein